MYMIPINIMQRDAPVFVFIYLQLIKKIPVINDSLVLIMAKSVSKNVIIIFQEL